jgi:hypothetical protein
MAGLPRRGFENRSRRGTAPVRYRSRTPRGTAPGWAGLPVRESAIVEAQDTDFSLEFVRVVLRSSWRLAPTEWPPAREQLCFT